MIETKSDAILIAIKYHRYTIFPLFDHITNCEQTSKLKIPVISDPRKKGTVGNPILFYHFLKFDLPF